MPEPQTTRIFLSHTSVDTPWCRRFVAYLEEAGADVWWDETDLQTGRLVQVISEAIRSHPVFIAVLSPEAMASEWVQTEMSAALTLQFKNPSERQFLPVVARKCEIPVLYNTYKMITSKNKNDLTAEEAADQVMSALNLKPPIRNLAPASSLGANVVSRIYGDWPLLGDEVASAWNVAFTREFNMSNDLSLFNEEGRGWPLYEGKMINQYIHRWDQPRFWVEPALGRSELARAEIARLEMALDEAAQRQGFILGSGSRQERVAELLRRLGRGPLTADDVRVAPDAYRLAFRGISRNTDERTMRATIAPAQNFMGNNLNFAVPWRLALDSELNSALSLQSQYESAIPPIVLAYLCGIFNSFTFDFVLRLKVKFQVNMFYTYQLPVPRLTPSDARLVAIAEQVARLVCVGPEFDALRRELLGDVRAHVAMSSEGERQALKDEIDALVAHLYGLSEDDLAHILYAPHTFPLVKRAVKDGVMAAYRRMA